MENKYSQEIQTEIYNVLNNIPFKNYFSESVEFYIDGWALVLKEKNLYPRSIVIFRAYKSDSFSIKSFEIVQEKFEKVSYNELYFKDNIKNTDDLLIELKEIICGKDLIDLTSNNYHTFFRNYN